MSRLVIAAAFLTLFALSPEAARAEKQADSPRFTCEFQKKEDTFAIEGKPGAETFQIRSATGIGSATITRHAGDWPKTVIIRFQKMQMLEHFVVKIGKTEFGGNWRSAEKGLYFDKDWKQLKGKEGAAFSLTIEVMDGHQGIEARLGLLANTRDMETLELAWIDAYR